MVVARRRSLGDGRWLRGGPLSHPAGSHAFCRYLSARGAGQRAFKVRQSGEIIGAFASRLRGAACAFAVLVGLGSRFKLS